MKRHKTGYLHKTQIRDKLMKTEKTIVIIIVKYFLK